MKILHVAASYHPSRAYGGPIVAMDQLVQAQAALGASVRVITTDADGRRRMPLRTADRGGASIRYFPARPLNSYGVSFGLWCASVMEAPRHDVVHLHGAFLPSTTVGLWSGYLQGVPMVMSPHGALMRWSLGQRAWRKRLYSVLDRRALRAALLHATSEDEADDLRTLGFQRVVMVPNGVNVEYFSARAVADIRVELGMSAATPVVAWLGRFDHVKNLEILIDATRGLGVQLLLGGDFQTDYGRAMQQRVRLQSRQDVHFLGYLPADRVRALLQQADVYAHPSLMESYGMSIVEALACSCPVVASTGTPWRALDERGAGRWVEPTVDRFRDAIAALIGRAGTATMRSAALSLASEHAWSKRAETMLAVYQGLREGRTT